MASRSSDPEPSRRAQRASLLRMADVAPVDVDGLAAVLVGLAVWLVALVLMLIFHERLADAGRSWWIVTDLIALGLGLFGLYYCLRRRSRLRRGLSADPSEGRFVRPKQD